ncbi:hypothetical protein M413DRAFT_384558 [Hebeloma cylindrosporum]|uniref:Uncharacterized protein n=1 Tax=Hebeloma cylindrosporum TaxID=76867 RepID=A0A0C2Y1B0_HEBCY|nr:hypothetical protein M413DRAFT_384558 [Hebeloma cylindrosporum h7]
MVYLIHASPSPYSATLVESILIAMQQHMAESSLLQAFSYIRCCGDASIRNIQPEYLINETHFMTLLKRPRIHYRCVYERGWDKRTFKFYLKQSTQRQIYEPSMSPSPYPISRVIFCPLQPNVGAKFIWWRTTASCLITSSVRAFLKTVTFILERRVTGPVEPEQWPWNHRRIYVPIPSRLNLAVKGYDMNAG